MSFSLLYTRLSLKTHEVKTGLSFDMQQATYEADHTPRYIHLKKPASVNIDIKAVSWIIYNFTINHAARDLKNKKKKPVSEPTVSLLDILITYMQGNWIPCEFKNEENK